jgi:serine/threonine protein kinase
LISVDWVRVKGVFQAAVERPRGEREAFLREACGDDETLRSEVESLFAAHDQAADFIEPPAGIEARLEASDPLCGAYVGPYRVLSQIGSGGMGTVYRAVRDDDVFHKEVALKVVRGGLAPDYWTDYLRRERNILAAVEHPNVARLLDGGTTDDGRPYFVMELVEGEPIDAYCESKTLTLRERVELLERVCATVQYLHQNLIVHRDLKPANILVMADGTPKLLDFGIAKLLRSSEEGGEATATALHALTPQYASPEQLRGEPITTASDVYSLGVLLYELLAGRRPFELAGLAPAEIVRIVCDVLPQSPSEAVRASEAPTVPRSTPPSSSPPLAWGASARRGRALAGDLDAVVMMTLRKEPSRRYGSAVELAEDLGRYLAGLPIRARPETLRYRAAKFVARHRVAAASAALVAITLVAGIASTLREWRRAESARVVAAHQAQRAAAVTRFFQQTLEEADPQNAGRAVTVVEALDAARAKIDEEFQGSPDVQGAIRATVGETYAGLGRYDEGERLLRSGLEAQRRELGATSAEVAGTETALGDLLREKGQLDEAQRLLEHALGIWDSLPAPDSVLIAKSLNALGVLYETVGNHEAATRVERRGIAVLESQPGANKKNLATMLGNLAAMVESEDRAEAKRLYRRSMDLSVAIGRRRSAGYSAAASNLGLLLKDEGDYARADPLLREAIAIDRELAGERHPDVAVGLNNLACLLRDQGRYAEAEPLFVEALGILEQALGRQHWAVGRGRGAYGVCLLREGRLRDAERELLAAHAILLEAFGPRDERTELVARNLATLYDTWKPPTQAARFHEASAAQ